MCCVSFLFDGASHFVSKFWRPGSRWFPRWILFWAIVVVITHVEGSASSQYISCWQHSAPPLLLDIHVLFSTNTIILYERSLIITAACPSPLLLKCRRPFERRWPPSFLAMMTMSVSSINQTISSRSSTPCQVATTAMPSTQHWLQTLLAMVAIKHIQSHWEIFYLMIMKGLMYCKSTCHTNCMMVVLKIPKGRRDIGALDVFWNSPFFS